MQTIGAMTGRLGPFRHQPFAVYWVGGTLSNAGSWLQTVAASVYVYDRTGSALAVGILNFAAFLPVLLFSVVGGVLSDRFDRRAIVVITHVFSALTSLALAAGIAAGLASEVHVVVVAFLLQTSWAIAKPSLTAMLPDLVPRAELTEAVGLNTLQFITGQLVGPLTAALILGTLGPGWAFGLNAVSFAGPILAMAYLARRGLGARRTRAAEGRTAAATPSGLRAYVRSQPWIASALLGVVATSAILQVIWTLAPVFVSERLGEPSSAAGLIVAAQGIGCMLGVVAFVPLQRRELSRRVAAAGLLVQAAGLVVASAATSLPVAAAAVVATGMGFSLCFPVVTGVLQSEVHDAVRGRVMSVHQMAHLGNRPFTALAVGALAASFGVPVAFLAATVLIPAGLVAVRASWRALDAMATPDSFTRVSTMS